MSSKFRVSGRMDNIRPFYVMQLLARAQELQAEGRSIVHMEVGEPDYVTADTIIQAGKAALDQGHTGYTPACGIPALRRALADHYAAHFSAQVSPKRIVVTPGASGALQLVLSVLINPGEEILMSDPGYPCNRHFVEHLSGRPVAIPVGPEEHFQLTAELVERHWSEKTRGVMVASPSNPTGTLISSRELGRIREVVRANGGQLIVDEIYQGLVYDGECSSALAQSDELFVINSFSKYFGMTGWRLGWLVAPEAYIDPIERLAQNIFLAPPTPAQYAALTALDDVTRETLEIRRAAFKERRDFLLPALQSLGFKIPVKPEGAFYLYADCSALTNDSFSFAFELLEAEGVAVTPGRDFGDHHPERYLRFAYTTAIPQLEIGIARIGNFLSR